MDRHSDGRGKLLSFECYEWYIMLHILLTIVWWYSHFPFSQKTIGDTEKKLIWTICIIPQGQEWKWQEEFSFSKAVTVLYSRVIFWETGTLVGLSSVVLSLFLQKVDIHFDDCSTDSARGTSSSAGLWILRRSIYGAISLYQSTSEQNTCHIFKV